MVASSVRSVTSSPAAPPSVVPLPQERNAHLSFEQVWPYISNYARQYGADPKVLAAIIAQESSFVNWGVHQDGTGHGMIGLDDNGLLPDFERWSGLSIGRGAGAATIPPEKQIEYLAKTIGELTRRHGSGFAAARVWHRGPGAFNDSRGQHYESLIRGHIERLFPGGATPPADAAPLPFVGTPQAATPAPSGAPSAQDSYRIRPGDTLWAIASRLKGMGVSGSVPEIISQIVAMNRQITDPNLIIAGDMLTLPIPGGAAFKTDDVSTGVGTALREKAAKVTGNATVREVTERESSGRYNVPHISQYRPIGAEYGYSNGSANCGPTSVAMIARALGFGEGMSDAALINHLGRAGGTTSNGTNVNGIIQMADEMGRKGEMRAGADVGWMVEQLKAGKLCIANGDYYAMPPHQNEAKTSGHYVCVCGLDEDGNFIVRDPADETVRTVTAAQMEHFLRSNPNGGYQFAIH